VRQKNSLIEWHAPAKTADFVNEDLSLAPAVFARADEVIE
jgi:hypothetical protein